ncbi:MAG TPA: hypothetical protein VFO45_05285 [Sphingomicrobium sp.]|nr:hypothetical protein [Sphingomicrobium sp.]
MARMMILGITAALAAIATAPASAQSGNWRTIAYKTVSGGTDVDRINVPGGRRWHQVRLCVFNAPLRMRDFDIRFDNGQRQDVRVRERIRPGRCTRNIDLNGRVRDIDWIRLKYERVARGYARPLVRVQAR